MSLIFQFPRTQQPTSAPRINGIAITAGLLDVAWTGTERARLLVGTTVPSSVGPLVATPSGVARSQDTAFLGAAVWPAASETRLQVVDGVTLMSFCGIEPSASNPVNTGVYGNTDGYFIRSSFGGFRSGGAGGLAVNAVALWSAGIKVRGLTYASPTLQMWDDGVAQESLGGGGALAYDAFTALNIGGSSAGAITAPALWTAIWSRVLSAAEILWLSRNPWQLFAALERMLWAPAVALPVLSAATVTSITSTTATPRVTVTI